MDYSAENLSLWNFIIQMGVIAVLILLSNLLKKNVGFFRRSLMPTAVLAGFLLLILRNLNILRIDADLLSTVTYHGIAIGFIAMALRIKKQGDGASSAKEGLQSGALIVSTYLMQAVVGVIVSLGLAYTVMPNLFKAAGILLPPGDGQGPGQANNIGSSYEALGFAGGRSFALSIAAAGYLCACIVGVIYMNILVRKNGAARRDPTGKMEEESLAVETFRDKDEIPISESIDQFSIQFALIAICYLLTYLICKFLSSLVPGLSSLLWGFNFIFGSLMAAIVTFILRKLREKGVMQKQYQNNFLLARISGFAFDLMIVGGIASIDIEDLSGLWVPFLLMAVLGGLATLVYLRWFCKKLFPSYSDEAFFGMYGMLTGTISSGVLLVRELDPDLKTPAAMNLVTGSSFGIAFGAPVLVLVGMAPSKLVLAVAIILVYWAALIVFLLRFKGFSKKKK